MRDQVYQWLVDHPYRVLIYLMIVELTILLLTPGVRWGVLFYCTATLCIDTFKFFHTEKNVHVSSMFLDCAAVCITVYFGWFFWA